MGYTIASEWFEHEIETLSALEIPAVKRFDRAKRALNLANEEFIAAQGELESIRTCKKDLIWQLSHFGGKE